MMTNSLLLSSSSVTNWAVRTPATTGALCATTMAAVRIGGRRVAGSGLSTRNGTTVQRDFTTASSSSASSTAPPPRPKLNNERSSQIGKLHQFSSPFARGQQMRFNSSFMRRVLDQVQKELEQNEGYQKAKKDFKDQGGEESAEKLKVKAAEQEEKLRKMKEQVEKASDSASDRFKAMRASIGEQQARIREQMSKQTEELNDKSEESEQMKNLKEGVAKTAEKLSSAGGVVFGAAKTAFGSTIDGIGKVTRNFEDDKAQQHKVWKQQKRAEREYKTELADKAEGEKAIREYAENMMRNKVQAELLKDDPGFGKLSAEEQQERVAQAVQMLQEAEAEAVAEKEQKEAPSTGGALVVKERSAWEKFGANVSDMPLLSSFLENPLLDRMFGETEIAQSLREMKEMEPKFTMHSMMEEIEHVVAPAIMKAYLEGDRGFLKLHCGEAAFMAVNASIQEREKEKVTLDLDIREGPVEIELKGARGMDGGQYHAPTFVFTFHAQQINCLRNKDGEVVEGAVDDIRNVYYAIAATRHPYCEEDSEKDDTILEFPWLISELAVIGNQSVW